MQVILRKFRNAKFSFTPLLSYFERRYGQLLKRMHVHIAETPDSIKNLVRTDDQSLICYTGLVGNIGQIILEKKMLREIQSPAVKFAIGGPLASGMPHFFLTLGFDYIFIGEGEKSFSAFIDEALRTHAFPPQHIIEGIPVELDEFPPYSFLNNSFPPVEIMRGCYFSCAYCQTPHLFSKKIRFRSIPSVLDAISLYYKRGIRDFRFLSPNAFCYQGSPGGSNNRAIHELLRQVKGIVGKEGNIFFGTFPSEVRPEFVDDEIVTIVKEFCVNKKIVLGLQSGSNRLLRMMRRGHSVEEVMRAIDILLHHSMIPIVDVMFGFPNETEEEMFETIRVSKEIIALGGIIHSHTFLPLPGTPLFTEYPAEIPETVKREISLLTSTGKCFGQWGTQEKLRNQFYHYLIQDFREP